MSDAPGSGLAAINPNMAGRIVELKVSGNLMTLDVGVFCLFQQPGLVAPPQDGSGLPGVRISIPPQLQTPHLANAPAQGNLAQGNLAQGNLAQGNPVQGNPVQGQVTIKGLHADGWLGLHGGAALVHVTGAPAQILITVYQSPNHPADTAPRLQVVPLSGQGAGGQGAGGGKTAPAQVPATAAGRAMPARAPLDKAITGKEIVAHIQRKGDVGVNLGEWMGKPGSGDWIEGFAITPRAGIAAEDIEYQAVLGKGWLSPWMTGGKFCGSRGMALPLLGFNLRLRGKAAEQFECEYSASFVDGSRSGKLAAGKSCEVASLSPLEAFQVVVRPRDVAAPAKRAKPGAVQPTAAKPAAKAPAPKKPAAPVRKKGR